MKICKELLNPMPAFEAMTGSGGLLAPDAEPWPARRIAGPAFGHVQPVARSLGQTFKSRIHAESCRSLCSVTRKRLTTELRLWVVCASVDNN